MEKIIVQEKSEEHNDSMLQSLCTAIILCSSQFFPGQECPPENLIPKTDVLYCPWPMEQVLPLIKDKTQLNTKALIVIVDYDDKRAALLGVQAIGTVDF